MLPSAAKQLESADGRLEVAVLDRRAKPDQRLLELVRRRVDALVHDDLGAPAGPLDLLDLALDFVRRDLVGRVDVVPHAKVVAVLSHDYVRVRDPLNVIAVRQQRGALLLGNVVQVELAALVAEQQEVAPPVQLKPVDLAVVRNLGDAHDTRGQHVE
jgi:hypothetical protein